MIGFYTIVGPDPAPGEERVMVYGNGSEIKIEILDDGLIGYGGLPLLLLLVTSFLFI